MENSENAAASNLFAASNVSPTSLPETDLLPAADARNMAVIFTVCSLFFGVFSPLVGFLTSSEKPWLKTQMKDLLNFQITVLVVLVVSFILNSTVFLAIIGIPLLVVVGIGDLVYLIIGAMKASKGEFYRYPWTVRLVS